MGFPYLKNRGNKMNDVNRLTLCKEDYKSVEEFHNSIRDAVMLLLNAGYIMTIKYDEPGIGIVCIDYEHAKQEYGCDYPHWLSPTEYESVAFDDDDTEQATWFINPDGYYPYCSNCGYEPDRPTFNKTNTTPYCPNCGRKMKGVENNG